MEYAVIFLIIFLAGFVQGAAGFGFGLVAVSLLSFFLNLKGASIILAIPSLCLNAVLLWRFRKHLEVKDIYGVVTGAVIGVPVGVFFLVNASIAVLSKFLGLILLITVLQRLFPQKSVKKWNQYYIGFPCGLFSGILSGAFSAGGPPVVAFIASQKFDRLKCSVSIQTILGIGTLTRCIVLFASRTIDMEMLKIGIPGIIFSVSGALCGAMVLVRLSDKNAAKAISALLLVVAGKYLFLS